MWPCYCGLLHCNTVTHVPFWWPFAWCSWVSLSSIEFLIAFVWNENFCDTVQQQRNNKGSPYAAVECVIDINWCRTRKADVSVTRFSSCQQLQLLRTLRRARRLRGWQAFNLRIAAWKVIIVLFQALGFFSVSVWLSVRRHRRTRRTSAAAAAVWLL